jgi:hypothetical protein
VSIPRTPFGTTLPYFYVFRDGIRDYLLDILKALHCSSRYRHAFRYKRYIEWDIPPGDRDIVSVVSHAVEVLRFS